MTSDEPLSVDDAPDPDSAEFLTQQNPVERLSPGTTADAPAVTPGLIPTDPTSSAGTTPPDGSA